MAKNKKCNTFTRILQTILMIVLLLIILFCIDSKVEAAANAVNATSNVTTKANGEGFGYISLSTQKSYGVREAPRKNSKTLFHLGNGTGVTLLEEVHSTDGAWYKIRYTKEQVGYIDADYIRVTKAPKNSSGTTSTNYKWGVVVNLTNTYLAVRSAATTSKNGYNELDKLYNGDVVEVLEVKENWVKVKTAKGEQGWCTAKYIMLTNTKPTTTPETTPTTKYKYGVVKVKISSSLLVRSKPSTNATTITKIYTGDVVEVLEIKSDFIKVRTSTKKEGWCTAKYLVLTNTKPFWGQVFNVSSYLNLREVPSNNCESLGKVYNNQIVLVINKSGNYYQVQNAGGEVGWSTASYINAVNLTLVSNEYTYRPGIEANSQFNANLACTRLTGHRIKSGTWFSWLGKMGACSKDKGFILAPIYANGELIKGYGGGVCQVSSTINKAAKIAGFKTEAKTHPKRVSYCEEKYEATVAYSSRTDFRLYNHKKSTIMLDLWTNNGTVVCRIFAL